jgi:hypothetical protein
MMRVLGPHFDSIVATRYHENPRALPAESLAATVSEITGRSCRACDDPCEAWWYVCDMAEPEDLIAISGSFYLAAEMRRKVLLSCGTGIDSDSGNGGTGNCGTQNSGTEHSRSLETIEPRLDTL